MCGICGVVGPSKDVDQAAMLAALTHRGPDDEGTFEEDVDTGHAVWLGHKRLSIVDLSPAGHQPMQSACGQLIISFNGEIYNHLEVRLELEKLGYTFRSRSDTEVLLSAWKCWGESCLTRFRGMFAFAIWDRSQKVLWLARDRLGEKPLYYTTVNGRLLFSSEVRSLLASGVVERRIDSDGLDAYLAFGSVTQPCTLVKNVKSVKAGHLVKYENLRLEDSEYWSLADCGECTSMQLQEATEEVREALSESVRQCMVSDVPVGVLLSGGVDSTAILSCLYQQGYTKLNTFSVIFDGAGEEYSEEAWSDKAAARFQSRHTKLRVSTDTAYGLLDKALDCMDQPSYDGFNHYMALHAVAQSGLKVAITGQGADELFWGYGRHGLFKARSVLATAHFSLRTNRNLQLISDYLLPARAKANKYLNLFESGDPFVLAYMSRHLIFSNQEISRLRGETRPSQAQFIVRSHEGHPLEVLYGLELEHFLTNTLLRDGDQMSMANSLELRAPFLDHRLVEVVTSIHRQHKSIQGKQKPLLVGAVGDDLVTEIAQRRKVHFSIPIRQWLKSGYGAAEMADVPELFDSREILRIKKRFLDGEYYTRYWSLCVLAHWVRKMGMLPPS
jgi:asparagine synthase (glutamine-hydrolysing)